MKTITYNEFLKSYNSGKLIILVNDYKAGNLLLSEFSKRSYKILHNLITWISLIILILVTIFIFWIFSYWGLLSIIFGSIIFTFARRYSRRLVLKQLLENEDFWNYALLHKCVSLSDDKGEEIVSEFFAVQQEKFSSVP